MDAARRCLVLYKSNTEYTRVLPPIYPLLIDEGLLLPGHFLGKSSCGDTPKASEIKER